MIPAVIVLSLWAVVSPRVAAAQGPSTKTAEPGASGPALAPKANPGRSNGHPFWDKKNRMLFAAVGASRGLDYSSSLNFRRRGRHEAFLSDATVDNHSLFAGIEAAGTAASIGVSYLFHRTGHHRLERWTSIVHFGLATSGAIRNYALPTVRPATAAPTLALAR